MLLCPLCRTALFYDHMMLSWYCLGCKKYFVYDEKEKSLRAAGSKMKFLLC